ncbi:MAG: hypothetical protein V1834_02220 [Candidatus Micrarchaeota archaeon]
MALVNSLQLFVFVAFPLFVYFLIRQFFESWQVLAEEEFKENIGLLIYALTAFTLLVEIQLLIEMGVELAFSDTIRASFAFVFLLFVLMTVHGFSRLSELFSFTVEEKRRFRVSYLVLALFFLFAAAAFVNALFQNKLVLSTPYHYFLIFLFGAAALVILFLLWRSRRIKERLTENLLVDSLNWNLYTLSFFIMLAQVHILFELTGAEVFSWVRALAFGFAVISLYVSTNHLLKFVKTFSFSPVVSESEFKAALLKPAAEKRFKSKRRVRK